MKRGGKPERVGNLVDRVVKSAKRSKKPDQVYRPGQAVTPRPSGVSFVPFSRGFKDHIPHYSGNAVKVYLHLILAARWEPGKKRGTVEATIGELARRLQMTWKTAERSLAELERGKPEIGLRPLIKANNRMPGSRRRTLWRVERYKGNVRDMMEER